MPALANTLSDPKPKTNTVSLVGAALNKHYGGKPLSPVVAPVQPGVKPPVVAPKPPVAAPPKTPTYNGPPMTTQPVAPKPVAPTTPQPQVPQWNLPQWNPQQPQYQPLTPTSPYAAPTNGNPANPFTLDQFLNTGKQNGLWDVNQYKSNDSAIANYISSVLPVATMQQNQAQYNSDFNEAQRRYNQDYNAGRSDTAYQQQLSTRAQLSAEEQARIAAGQWNQDFAQRKQTDQWGNEIARGDLANQVQQTANNLQIGMGQIQGQQNVANTYAGAQNYGANQQLAGTKYQSDAQKAADMYQAQLGLQGQMGTAGLYSNAQKYQADQQRLADYYQAQQGLAGTRYQADQSLNQANLYSQAQRYGANQQLAGTQYESNTQKAIANQQNAYLMAQLQQQAQQQQLERENMLAITNAQVYGRGGAAPNVNWARSWA